MSYAKDIEPIEAAYYENDGEDKDTAIEQLQALHVKAIQAGKAEDFFQEAKSACGGVYQAHLLWVELAGLLNGKGNFDHFLALIEAFANSDFDDEDTRRMKPLLVVYFMEEKPFDLDKIRSRVVAKAHPGVQEYFEKIENFAKGGSTIAETYRKKFKLVKNYFPNFELYNLPISRLEEHVAENA